MTELPGDLIKPIDIFKDPSLACKRKRWGGYWQMACSCARFLNATRREPIVLPRPFAPRRLPTGFFAMNLSPSPEPEGDEIQLEALRDLGVEALRIDYGAYADRTPADRLIERVLDAGYPLTLHAVQKPSEAASMDRPAERERWRVFLKEALFRYGDRIEALEVGSNPNRSSWSGYTIEDYAAAARIARELVDERAGRGLAAPRLIGPNVNDFAPYFSIALLDACRRAGARFDVMSDNLFIDRVGEPEAYDPHVLGRALKGLGRMDMLRKQRALAAIGRYFGLSRVWCTYGHYTLNFGTPRVRYVSEEQYANYMVRAHVLTAAAGNFERYYWGTLVTHFKGLIDEVTRVRPYPPFAHHRFAILGAPSLWKRREGLMRSYITMVRNLKQTTFVMKHDTSEDTYALEFAQGARRVVVRWMRDARSADVPVVAGEESRRPSRILDREGNAVDAGGPRVTLSPAPQYWIYGE